MPLSGREMVVALSERAQDFIRQEFKRDTAAAMPRAIGTSDCFWIRGNQGTGQCR